MAIRPMRYVMLLAFAAAIGLEYLAGRMTGRHRYDEKELGTNVAIFFLNRFVRASFGAWAVLWLEPCYRLAPFRLPPGLSGFLMTLVLTDFVYYWQHRLVHASRWLWPFHAVHHSSHTFNLAAAGRLSWFNFLIMPLFFVPLALAGAPPKLIAASMFVNLSWQFFLHTRWIGTLGPLEGFLNTPSAHRVHHAANECYQGRNFGGLLLVWDRLFGTYRAEGAEPVRFGIPGRAPIYDPFRAQLEPFTAWWSPIKEPARRTEKRI